MSIDTPTSSLDSPMQNKEMRGNFPLPASFLVSSSRETLVEENRWPRRGGAIVGSVKRSISGIWYNTWCTEIRCRSRQFSRASHDAVREREINAGSYGPRTRDVTYASMHHDMMNTTLRKDDCSVWWTMEFAWKGDKMGNALIPILNFP